MKLISSKKLNVFDDVHNKKRHKMGQILNRIKNLTKAYMSDSDEEYYAQRLINADQDELKRIIDNLNVPPKREKTHNSTNSNSNANNQNKQSTSNNSSATITLADAYKVLEINANTDIEAIKTAYKTKIKEYHPDKVQTMGKEIQEIANRKTKEINDAYNLIKKHRNF